MERRKLLQGLFGLTALSCLESTFMSGADRVKQKSQNRALLLGIDGVRVDAFKKSNTPNLDKIAQNGAYSYRMQADTPTWSGHEWSNVLTGVNKKKHGVQDNSFNGENFKNYPSIFGLINQVKPELNILFDTLSVVPWGGLYNHIVTEADVSIYHDHDDNLVEKELVTALKSFDYDFIFTHFLAVDSAGHEYGFHPDISEYLSKIEETDKRIDRIMKTITERKNYQHENWLVMVVTDHGGLKTSHGGDSPEERNIFSLVYGKEVLPGELYPVPKHQDLVPTLLKHFKIPVKKKWDLDGRVIALK